MSSFKDVWSIVKHLYIKFSIALFEKTLKYGMFSIHNNSWSWSNPHVRNSVICIYFIKHVCVFEKFIVDHFVFILVGMWFMNPLWNVNAVQCIWCLKQSFN
jgi:hypothetical protein